MNVVAVILGGGKGERLQPLTLVRSKPAVPIAGKYRLVDVPISNCIHSNIRQIFLLTQFNSVSLHEHIHASYQFDQFHPNFIRILAAQQTLDTGSPWFEGTADAVRKTFSFFAEQKPDLILILSGDHIYRMDFNDLINQHMENKADVSICTQPVERDYAGDLGIMQVDAKQKIFDFIEKPGNTPALEKMRAPMYEDERYLASMGIYLFNADTLERLLKDKEKSDFGKHVIPEAIATGNAYSYIFDGYWKDVGSIRVFWESTLALTDPVPPFDLYDSSAPFYTHMRYLPSSKVNHCDLDRCLLSEGCIISAKHMKHSVVGVRAVVGEGTVIEDSILMGADFYEPEPKDGRLPIGIGKDCVIRTAIIDKNARIGNGVTITPEGKADDTVTELYTVKDGIIVIPKNTTIPDGTTL